MGRAEWRSIFDIPAVNVEKTQAFEVTLAASGIQRGGFVKKEEEHEK